jgi:arsenate reductase
MTAHWGIEDPAAVEGTDLQKEAAFIQAFRYLKNRIAIFTSLPFSSIDSLSLGMANSVVRSYRREYAIPPRVPCEAFCETRALSFRTLQALSSPLQENGLAV